MIVPFYNGGGAARADGWMVTKAWATRTWSWQCGRYRDHSSWLDLTYVQNDGVQRFAGFPQVFTGDVLVINGGGLLVGTSAAPPQPERWFAHRA